MLHYIPHLRPIALNNIHDIPAILSEHINDGATSSSAFLTEADIPSVLDPYDCPEFHSTTIHVLNTDALTAAVTILDKSGNEDDEDEIPMNKTIVLNSCSDERPGGAYAALLEPQPATAGNETPPSSPATEERKYPLQPISLEESLCLCTTLYTTLHKSWYPWPNIGENCVRGIYSPGVVIFRNPKNLELITEHEERHVVSMLSISAPYKRPLDPCGTQFRDAKDLEYLRRKLRFWLRVAAMNGQERLVLGAWGCGTRGCPNREVAEEMRRALEEKEFKGWFREVVFAIKDFNGEGNYDLFKKVLEGVVI